MLTSERTNHFRDNLTLQSAQPNPLHAQNQPMQLGIEDNGNGFEVPPRMVDLIYNDHYGMVGSAERAEAIGGTLTIDSQPGRGTTIFVNGDLAKTPL